VSASEEEIDEMTARLRAGRDEVVRLIDLVAARDAALVGAKRALATELLFKTYVGAHQLEHELPRHLRITPDGTAQGAHGGVEVWDPGSAVGWSLGLGGAAVEGTGEAIVPDGARPRRLVRVIRLDQPALES
jgi:hypothetical protein